MLNTVFALTLFFADGYVGGSSHMRDFNDSDSCNKYGAKIAQQYASWGHPASFLCVEVKAQKHPTKPEVIRHTFPTMPSG